jgi:hypothetical protein
MKIRDIIYIILTSILIVSCQETVSTNGLPYTELIVISGELIAGESISNIYITRTLPPLDNYYLDSALITDAKAYLELNNTKYELKFNSFSKTYYCDSIIPKVGDKFKINVYWNGHNANGITTIPDKVDSVYNIKTEIKEIVDNYGYQFSQLIISAFIKSSKNVVIYSGTNDFETYNSKFFVHKLNQNFNSNLLLFTSDYYTSEYIADTLIIGTFDLDFYDYYTTKNNGNQNDDAFSINADFIKWNIKGDGIGLFIGSNREFIPLSN